MIAVGFHGTTLKAARAIGSDPNILHMKKTQRSKWLGIGAYFFQEGPEHAWAWAQICSARRGGDQPMVARAEIDLSDTLDLLDCRYWDAFRRFISTCAIASARQLGPEALFRALSDAERSRLYNNVEDDYYVSRFVEAIRLRGAIVSSIRCSFIEGSPLHPSSWFFDQSHVQICVKDAGIIKAMTWLDPGSR